LPAIFCFARSLLFAHSGCNKNPQACRNLDFNLKPETTSDMQSQTLSNAAVLLFAVACGLVVANVYYAQPLLDAMAKAFAMSPAIIGIVITLTRVGYGIGLVLLVHNQLRSRPRNMLSSTSSRRTQPWNNAAAKCSNTVRNSR
jgi:hypothetical protein